MTTQNDADKTKMISEKLKNMDPRVRAILADQPVKRTDVYAAHEKVFGARPDKSVGDGKPMDEWNRRFEGDMTRLARAGLLLNKDGSVAVPSGKTQNPGVRGARTGAVSGTSDVVLHGKPFTAGMARGLVAMVSSTWEPERLADALRAHGYTFKVEDVYGADGKDVIGSVKKIVDPVALTPYQRARAEFVANTRTSINGMVLDGDIDASKAEAAIAKQIARWDAANPDPAIAEKAAAEKAAAEKAAAEKAAAEKAAAEKAAAEKAAAEKAAAENAAEDAKAARAASRAARK